MKRYTFILLILLSACSNESLTDQINRGFANRREQSICSKKMLQLPMQYILDQSQCHDRQCIERWLDQWISDCERREDEQDNE